MHRLEHLAHRRRRRSSWVASSTKSLLHDLLTSSLGSRASSLRTPCKGLRPDLANLGNSAHGRVMEVGSPAEHYGVSRTTSAAEFLGTGTKIAGSVLRADHNGKVLVRTGIGDSIARTRSDLIPGD